MELTDDEKELILEKRRKENESKVKKPTPPEKYLMQSILQDEQILESGSCKILESDSNGDITKREEIRIFIKENIDFGKQKEKEQIWNKVIIRRYIHERVPNPNYDQELEVFNKQLEEYKIYWEKRNSKRKSTDEKKTLLKQLQGLDSNKLKEILELSQKKEN